MKKRSNTIVKTLFLIFFFTLLASTFSIAEEQTNLPSEWLQEDKDEYIYNGNEKIVTIPAQITSIEYLSFINHTVVAIIIPKTVTKVGYGAFYNANLKYLVFEGDPVIEASYDNSAGSVLNVTGPAGSSNVKKWAELNSIPYISTKATCFYKKKVLMVKGEKFRQLLCNNILPITWSSSNRSVASVTGKGVVKGKKKGSAVITAKTSAGSFSYKVKVYERSISTKIKLIKKEIKADSTLAKIKAAHNWLIENIDYDFINDLEGTIPRSSYKPEGALFKKVAVCSGYAKAFKLLMDSYKIPCRIVSGGNHVWNMVKLDRKWYHVDVTLDDFGIIHEYTYFLKSTKYMKRKRHSFNTSKYPKCNSQKYDAVTVF